MFHGKLKLPAKIHLYKKSDNGFEDSDVTNKWESLTNNGRDFQSCNHNKTSQNCPAWKTKVSKVRNLKKTVRKSPERFYKYI